MDQAANDILRQLQMMQQAIAGLTARQENIEAVFNGPPHPPPPPPPPPASDSGGDEFTAEDETKAILKGVLKWEWNLPNDRRLNEKNWPEWKAVFCAEIQGLGLETDVDVMNLPLRYQQKIGAQVLRNLSKEIAQTVIYHTNFREMWQILSSYESSLETSISEELTTLLDLECKGDPLEFVTKVRSCHAALAALGKPIAAHEKVHLFFKAVGKKYPFFSQNLHYRITRMANQDLAFEELIGEFKSMVGQRKLTGHFDSTDMKNNDRNRDREHQRDGHLKGNWKSKSSASNSSSERTKGSGEDKQRFLGKCNHCGTDGHKKEDCWKLHPEKKPKNYRQRSSVKKEETNAVSDTPAISGFIAFPQTQLQPSLELIMKSVSNGIPFTPKWSIRNRWMFDTGASVHIINDAKWFVVVPRAPKENEGVMTGGGGVNVEAVGTAKLTTLRPDGTEKDFLLYTCFLCPDFPVNLCSGQKLYQKGGRLRDGKILVPDGRGDLDLACEIDVNNGSFFMRTKIPKKQENSYYQDNGEPSFVYSTFTSATNKDLDEFEPERPESIPTSNKRAEQYRLWHRRLMHPGRGAMVATHKITNGINPEALQSDPASCSDCDVVMAAIHILNRSSTTALKDSTPYEAFMKDIGKVNCRPDLEGLRVLGCTVIVNIPPDLRMDAMKADSEARTWKGILVGFEGEHIYRIWDPIKKTVTITSRVIFHEPAGLEPPVFRSVPRGTTRNSGNKVQCRKRAISMENNEHCNLAEAAMSIWTRAQAMGESWNEIAFTSMELAMAIAGPLLAKKAVGLKEEGSTWRALIYKELQQLLNRGVLNFVEQAHGRRKLSTRFVLTRNSDKTPKKARLVARGYLQRHGLDYTDTFASTSRCASWKILCSLAVLNKWKIRQIDVVGAYLLADLKEEIYVEEIDLLKDFFQDHGNEAIRYGWKPGKDIRLMKALYGLKQAGYEWQAKLRKVLGDMGMNPLLSDPAVYHRKELTISSHVDDLLAFGKNVEKLDEFELELSKRLDLKLQGEPEVFLGVEMSQQNGQIQLSQSLYVEDIADRFELANAKNIRTPLDEGIRERKRESMGDFLSPAERVKYQAMVGALMYLATTTRPDISFAVGFLARSMATPYAADIAIAKRVIRYARASLNLNYNGGNDKELVGYCDSDWAGEQETGKSTTGWVFLLGGNPIAWSSKRQPVVARSTAEAEYYAASSATAEAAWITNFLDEIGCSVSLPIVLRSDNQAAINIAESTHISARTRHIRLQYHYIKQEVMEGKIRLEYVKSNDQIADVLTKPLGSILHARSLAQLKLTPAL